MRVMRATLLGLFAIALIGCAMHIQHSPAGPNTYLVTVEGKSHHSHAELMHAANRRALEICGPGGFDVVASSSGSQIEGHANQQAAYVSTKGSVSMYVRCR